MAKIEKNFPDKFAEIKIIWKSPLIPSDPIVWHSNFSTHRLHRFHPEFVQRLG